MSGRLAIAISAPSFSAGRALLGLAAVAVTAALMPVPAAGHGFDKLGGPVKEMLIKASDKALDKLGQPGAFSADDAIRIAFPERPEQADAAIKMAHDAGAIDSLQRTINDAAGQAAAQAKPVFDDAINRITLKDSYTILSHKDGATHYLWETAGPELRQRLHAIIGHTLANSGAFAKLGKLKSLGLFDKLAKRDTPDPVGMSPQGSRDAGPSADSSRDDEDSYGGPPPKPADFSVEGMTDSVTDQAMSAIFKYIAHEEHKLRKDPSAAMKHHHRKQPHDPDYGQPASDL